MIFGQKRAVSIFAVAIFLAMSPAPAEDDPLPKADENVSFEIEPPLLIKDNVPIAQQNDSAVAESQNTPDHLQKIIERAKKNAAAGERQFRAGIISRVEMELRALKIVRLECDLAHAQADLAKAKASDAEARLSAGEISKEEIATVRDAAQLADDAAKIADATRERAELDAALRNLERQKKLLALGSAKKSDVNRAQQKIAELAAPQK